MLFLWISIGLFVLSMLALVTMLGCWTYTDAKKRSDKPEVWTLIVLLVPNFIGLIIYLLIGRTKKADDPAPGRNRFFIPLIAFGITTVITFISTLTATILVSLNI
jgi:hypothetical protein